jgi:cytidine deaminase
MSPVPASLQALYDSAKSAREKAYSPYSGVKVGAAIRTADDRVYSGSNVENSSYGATVCAERVAISKAVSETGRIQITEVMVVTDASPAWPPCGICRQVIAEFARTHEDQTRIHCANLQGEMKTYRFSEIFPDAFTPEHLHR